MVRKRLVILTLLVLVPFGVVVARLANLQLHSGNRDLLVRRSDHLSVEYTPPMRGRLIARTGEIFADNQSVYTIHFVDVDLDPLGTLITALHGVLRERYGKLNADRVRQHVFELTATWTAGAGVNSPGELGASTTPEWQPLLRALDLRSVRGIRQELYGADMDFRRRARLLSFRKNEHDTALYDLWVSPLACGTRERVLLRLAKLLVRHSKDDPPKTVITVLTELKERVRAAQERSKSNGDLPRLVTDVPLQVITPIEYYPEKFRGLRTGLRWRRIYPQGELFGSIVGFVRQHDERQYAALKRDNRFLEFGQWPGAKSLDAFREQRSTLWGHQQKRGDRYLEKFYNDELRGSYGARVFREDADRIPVETIDELRVQDGSDVVTTIDVGLQRVLHEQLRRIVEGHVENGDTTYAESHVAPVGHAASAVVLDVESGAILAAAGVPSVDPNRLWSNAYHGELKEKWAHRAPGWLMDRPTRHINFPGSVFKVVVAAAALENADELGYSPTDVFHCSGEFKEWRDARCSGRHGAIDLATALQVSCNIYFYHLGWKVVGAERIHQYAARFGYGHPTGVDLPGRERGFIKPASEASGGKVCHYAIGQVYVKATALQVARSLGLIARGGDRVPRPYFVRPTPEPGLELQPVLKNSVTIATIHEGLWRAAHEKGGTAARHGLDAFRVAVKTGTAELGQDPNEDSLNVAWIAGYAPAAPDGIETRRPKIAFAIAVEKTDAHGAAACAPVLRAMLRHFAESDPEAYRLKTPAVEGGL